MSATVPDRDLVPAAHPWLLLAMWRRVRLASGFFIATALLLLVRILCSPLDPLPGEARFMPLFILGPVLAVVLGPAGVWAAPAASLLADFTLGQWTDLTWFRAAGEFAAAMHVFVFWDSSFFRWQCVLSSSPGWCQAIRFIALAIPAGLIASAWNALGAELCGSHGFGGPATLEGVQVVFFGLLLGPSLFRIAARDFSVPLGDWRIVARQAGRRAHWRPVGLLVGCFSATMTLPAGELFITKVTGAPPWAGQSTGGLAELLAALLAAHLLTVLWPD